MRAPIVTPRMMLAVVVAVFVGIALLPQNSLSSVALTAKGEGCVRKPSLVATTPLIADIVRQVALPNMCVTSLVPSGADPHTYEATLEDVRTIAHADVVFSNHLLLEEQSVMRAIQANLPKGGQHVMLAEQSKRYGARLIQLVEDAALDTVWLGMRVRDSAVTKTADSNRNQEIRIRAVKKTGPGDIAAFLTGTFGQPQVYINTADGFDDDSVRLPVNAHTHMSWAFTKPGIYTLDVEAALAKDPDATKQEFLARTTLTFAVGTDPTRVANKSTIIREGHMDIAIDMHKREFTLFGDRVDKKPGDTSYLPSKTVIAVPHASLNQIPPEPSYRFLGRPGHDIYLLAQAVLGKHVHGEIDPHVWQDVGNVIAFTQVIRDTLISYDPSHRDEYTRRAKKYVNTLTDLNKYVQTTLSSIPESHRNIVTTHDAYGYLGAAYGMTIAGFVTPNPNIEPSTRDLIRLNATLGDLHVPAVFIEPTLARHAGDLISAARSRGVNVCTVYGDTFDEKVTTYVQMMATNAYHLKTCLDPDSLPPPRFHSQAGGT
ncbi:MAG: anchored repeat ABC transporter, substrate-binding protein [Actinomycetaceae bacterium]|nr:anchored repeat ABC transporter, substrate-binding protein [Actinomycetaceae bacterium]